MWSSLATEEIRVESFRTAVRHGPSHRVIVRSKSILVVVVRLSFGYPGTIGLDGLVF
jgi:hypothetical protein